MKIKTIDQEFIEIKTKVYQAKNGGIYLVMGNKSSPLPYEIAEKLIFYFSQPDIDKFHNFYKGEEKNENHNKKYS